MQKLFILLFIFLNASAVCPDGIRLHVKLKDGNTVIYAIDDITRIEFTGFADRVEDIQKVQHLVHNFKLMQNYPNPFNPSTTIQYDIPEASKVKICVYNLNAQLIKTLIQDHQHAGLYQVIWDGTNESGNQVSSGVYMYTVKFKSTVSAKKMILLK